jgi:hypothetical protein
VTRCAFAGALQSATVQSSTAQSSYCSALSTALGGLFLVESRLGWLSLRSNGSAPRENHSVAPLACKLRNPPPKTSILVL